MMLNNDLRKKVSNVIFVHQLITGDCMQSLLDLLRLDANPV